MTDLDFDRLWSLIKCQYSAWCSQLTKDATYKLLHGFDYSTAEASLQKWTGEHSRSARPDLQAITHLCFDAVQSVRREVRQGTWTHLDELLLRQWREYYRGWAAGGGEDITDERICRELIGKSRCQHEAQEASRILDAHATATIERMSDRGDKREDAVEKLRVALLCFYDQGKRHAELMRERVQQEV